MNEFIFETGSVPVRVAARVYGKDASWVRAGIICGWLPIGTATRDGERVTDLKQMDHFHINADAVINEKDILKISRFTDEETV